MLCSYTLAPFGHLGPLWGEHIPYGTILILFVYSWRPFKECQPKAAKLPKGAKGGQVFLY
jgi:hypothetical protein